MEDNRGFTLIELMIVVAIIATLSLIALPKFSNIVVRSRESGVKGSLAALRGAVQIYYSGEGGIFPSDLSEIVVNSTYLTEIPQATIPGVTEQNNPGHPAARGVLVGDGTVPSDVAGGSLWYYVNSGDTQGSIFANCTHKDTSGQIWTSN